MNANEPTDPDLTLDAPTPARENEILAALLANGEVEPEAIGRSLSTLTVLGWRVHKCRECESVKVTRAPAICYEHGHTMVKARHYSDAFDVLHVRREHVYQGPDEVGSVRGWLRRVVRWLRGGR